MFQRVTQKAAAYVFCLLVLFSVQVRADQRMADAVSPFADDRTVIVVRVQPHLIDAKAIGETSRTLLTDAMVAQIGMTREEVREALEAYVQDMVQLWRKAGAKEVYILLTTQNVLEGPPPSLVIVPGIQQLAPEAWEALSTQVAHPFILVKDAAVSGSPAEIEHIRQHGGQLNESLRQAVVSLNPNAAVSIAAAPSAEIIAVVENILPTLPPSIGGQQSTIITRNFQWLTLALHSPPKLGLQVQVQAGDTAGAKQLATLIDEIRANIIASAAGANADQAGGAVQPGPPILKLAELFTPQVQGNSLRLALNQEKTELLLREGLLPSLLSGRSAANHAASAANVKQLCMGAYAYAIDNNDKLPTRLSELHEGDYVFDPTAYVRPHTKLPADFNQWDKAKVNQWIDTHSDYVLVPNLGELEDERHNPAKTILIFEKLTPRNPAANSRIAVGYLDGHAEVHELEKAKELIKTQTGKTLEEWSK